MTDIKLTFVGYDFWSMPNYKTPKGILLVDMSPRSCIPSLFTKVGNDMDEDPDSEVCVKPGFRLVFSPKRYGKEEDISDDESMPCQK